MSRMNDSACRVGLLVALTVALVTGVDAEVSAGGLGFEQRAAIR